MHWRRKGRQVRMVDGVGAGGILATLAQRCVIHVFQKRRQYLGHQASPVTDVLAQRGSQELNRFDSRDTVLSPSTSFSRLLLVSGYSRWKRGRHFAGKSTMEDFLE